MTGIQLKNEIKKLGITQEDAANKLGVTRTTVINWCKQADLPYTVVQNVKTMLGININDSESDNYIDLIKSQQRTIENLSEIIKSLTSNQRTGGK